MTKINPYKNFGKHSSLPHLGVSLAQQSELVIPSVGRDAVDVIRRGALKAPAFTKPPTPTRTNADNKKQETKRYSHCNSDG